MAGDSGTEFQDVEFVLKGISRHINCLQDDNRNTRKRALDGIKKELLIRKPDLDPDVFHSVLLNHVIKHVLKILSDPVEKCRDLAVTFISESHQKSKSPNDFLPYVIPTITQRLGQKEIIEQSEEIRLSLVGYLTILIDLCQKSLAVYLDDYVKILQRTLIDPYPEVKKTSCKCASKLAQMIPEPFHMQSEALIKPLLETLSHQHSRVRVEAVNAIGAVIQYGNGKSVDDVVSHLAQRLFDQAPTVRSAVIAVVGGWLLDLLDRYSFFHKLIPLLLTGLQDEMPDIRSKAEALWHDVGLKYETENESDLKDKQDFVKRDPDHYPPGIERPNLGCRELMYSNFSKILSGLLRDLTDWVVATRIKSSQLLYVMILNEEDNVTQHLQKVLNGLYKACQDDEADVVSYALKSSELIGYFVTPEVWCHMVLEAIKMSQSSGTVMVMAAILRGSRRDLLKPHLAEICAVLKDPLICEVADSKLQDVLIDCVSSIAGVSLEDCNDVSQDLFDVLVTVLAISRGQEISFKTQLALALLASSQGLSGPSDLYSRHTKPLIQSMQGDYALWTQHSVQRMIFDTLLMEAGPHVGEILEDIIPILKANLQPEKDAEVRLKFFTLLSRLVLKAPQTVDSQNKFGGFAVVVVRDMVLPNMVWRAGRTAAAIHTTAVSCLWALLESQILTKDRIEQVLEELLTQLLSSLDNDNKQTRLITCRIITRVFKLVGTSLDRDRLHNIYPELMKRLDDNSDDIRIAVSKTFLAYFDCFGDDYQPLLYQAHLRDIYKGLLIHLDDPESKIQEAVFEVLVRAAELLPAVLMEEVDGVRFKHRSTFYLDKLSAVIKSLPVAES